MPKRKNEDNDTMSKNKQEFDDSKDANLDSRPPDGDANKDDGITHYKIPYNDKAIVCERQGGDEKPALIFTHGAGGGIEAPATRDFATGFGTVSPITCYQGNLNLQSRIRMFHTVIEHEQSAAAFGGRSMGARAAVLTTLEMEEKPQALVLVSWPLMAGSKGDKREPERREQILLDLPENVDVLFVVGTEDAQCGSEQFAELRGKMKARHWLVEVQGADHGMDLKQKDGVQPMRMKTGSIAAEWLLSRDEKKSYCSIAWDQEASQVVSDGWNDQLDAEGPTSKKREA